MTRLLVAGSYPPVPGPAAAATLAAVGRGWDDGRQVEVVAPRLGAAHHAARLTGIRAARSLSRLRRETQADELVLSMEPGMPFTPGGHGIRHRVEAMALAIAFARYSKVTVLMTSDVGVSAGSLALLWPRVHRVVTVPGEERGRLVSCLGVPTGLVTVEPERRPPPETDCSRDLITPGGPPEWQWSEQPRRFASLAARRVLGRRADSVRARLVPLIRPARE